MSEVKLVYASMVLDYILTMSYNKCTWCSTIATVTSYTYTGQLHDVMLDASKYAHVHTCIQIVSRNAFEIQSTVCISMHSDMRTSTFDRRWLDCDMRTGTFDRRRISPNLSRNSIYKHYYIT